MSTPKETSFGFVVVSHAGSEPKFLFVRQSSDGHWGFPKGHPEAGETPLETARRELMEECSVSDISLRGDHVFEETYRFVRNGVETEKTNTFFIATVATESLAPQAGEISECRYLSLGEASGLPLYADTRRILGEAAALFAAD